MPGDTTPDISALVGTEPRYELWSRFIRDQGIREMAEVGVFRGMLAQRLLDRCPGLTRYYLIDPWRHLDDWNKPANSDDETFERFYDEALQRTKAYARKRVVLRGRTSDVVDQIPDGSLDLAYVDGDHTLRGITIDLVRLWPKIRPGGFLGGDDFKRWAWTHGKEYEPTLVFPWAVYFAEAVDASIYALPHAQFLIHKASPGRGFTDATGRYPSATVMGALRRRRGNQSQAET